MLSLENLCLNLIIKKFEKFFFAFKVSNNGILKKNFKFLQMIHSYTLASKLFEDGKMEGKYLEFLLNEHLKVLNGCWLNDYLTLTEDIFCRLPNLIKLSFPIKCCDDDLRHVARFCPKLVEIDVKQSHVTNDGLKYLCKDENGKLPCPELKKLFVRDSRITDEGIKYLIQNLPSLESIDIDSTIPQLLYSLHKDDYENVQVYNLIRLNFQELSNLPYFNNMLKICLTVCPKVKTLVGCMLSDEVQLNLLNNTNLERLQIQFSQTAPKININNFLKNAGCNLSFLNIENCTMSITDLAVNCRKLNFLLLASVDFTDDNDSHPVFPCLKICNFFDLRDDSSSKKAMHYFLFCSPKLEYVGFSCSILSLDTKLDILKCCESRPIKRILLAYYTVDMNFAKDILENCHTLKILYLFNGTDPDTQEIVKLAESLPNKPQIEINKLSPEFFSVDQV